MFRRLKSKKNKSKITKVSPPPANSSTPETNLQVLALFLLCLLSLLSVWPHLTTSSISTSPMKIAEANPPVKASTKAYPCKERHDYGGKYGGLYQSQAREDKIIIQKYFDQVCGGTYIEMGGFDGKTFSNTYVFHKAADWKGVLVEASPTNYAKMIVNRPNEIANVNAGVCSEERDLHWVNKNGRKGAVSGFVEFAAESFKKQWWTEQQIRDATIVRCRTLKSILHEIAVGDQFHFDIFSLDVEGAELEALSSLDFNLVSFGIILVESDNHNEPKNKEVKKILTKNGYKYDFDRQNSQWFVNENFDAIYDGVTMKH
jgi:FkbM family methyltransferase